MKLIVLIFTFIYIPILGAQNKYISFYSGIAFSTVKEKSVDGTSWIYRSSTTEKDKKKFNHLGFKMGLQYLIELNKKISISGGLRYVKLGAKSKLPIINTTDIVREIHHFNYLNLPLKVHYLIKSDFDIQLFIGASFDYLMSHERLSKSKNPNFNSVNGTSLIRNIARTNQSFLAGTSFLFNIDSRFKFLVNIEYARSIVDFNKRMFDDDRLYHRSLSLTTGLRYLLNE